MFSGNVTQERTSAFVVDIENNVDANPIKSAYGPSELYAAIWATVRVTDAPHARSASFILYSLNSVINIALTSAKSCAPGTAIFHIEPTCIGGIYLPEYGLKGNTVYL